MQLARSCILLLFFFVEGILICNAQQNPRIVEAGLGWAKNSVNVVVFRKNALTSRGNAQYIAYYDNDSTVVLGKRILPSSKWVLKKTVYKGNVTDAHNSISIMADGDGYLHMAWDHHGHPLRYCKSIAPGSLELTEKLSMTGKQENKVTYPEFYRLPNGNLLFFYRDGQSGNGNLVINRYDTKTKQWQQLQNNLVDGEGQRNAYWQACVDAEGTIHLSWVWRESPDVASNHDLCYAKSEDGGISWKRSGGGIYQLPITAATAEYIVRIPQGAELINQTSMYALEDGTPLIASYWKEPNDPVPQYHVVYLKDNRWENQNLGFRKTAFSLSGAGTKRIPISRPQLFAWKKNNRISTALIFRDEERGNKVSVAISYDLSQNKWEVSDLGAGSVGAWEPSFDTELWKTKKQLHLFVQRAEQEDSEGKTETAPQPVRVLEWTPLKIK